MATKKKKSKDNTERRHGVSFTEQDVKRIQYIRALHETTVTGAIRMALKNYATANGYTEVSK